MKKSFATVLVLSFCTVMHINAEDAKVMPLRVGRIYLAPTLGFANGKFDSDGRYDSYSSGEGSKKLFNLGLVAEYGITDWISGAIQWAPGWNVWSDVDKNLGSKSDVNINGVADLFVGAKVQIIGEKAPVKTDMFRLSLAPGLKIPMPGSGFEEQAKNIGKNDPVTAANIDKHVLGTGVRFFFDYIINDNFFINLYSEFLLYPVKGDLKKSGLEGYGVAAAVFPASVPGFGGKKIVASGTVNYGYDLTFELEPVFSMPMAEGTTFAAGLPFNFKLTPGKDYDITYTNDFKTLANAMPPVAKQIKQNVEGNLTGEDPTYFFSIKPNVSMFFRGWTLPTELKLLYSVPVAGKNNVDAMHSLTFQVRLYFKI